MHPEQSATVQTVRRETGVVDRSSDHTEHENCAICLSTLAHAVGTNCGHTFCAVCLLSYWQHDQWPRPARCAVCRTPVSTLSTMICIHTTDPLIFCYRLPSSSPLLH